ncbi:MAG: B12-binding domain-containing radical SAM protein [Polyangia bacterium]
MRVLLITPPMVQLNTAYPAVPALAAFLTREGYQVAQSDLSLALALKLFSRPGIDALARAIRAKPGQRRPAPSVLHFLAHLDDIAGRVDEVVGFLQGRAPQLTDALLGQRILPSGPRSRALRGLIAGSSPAVVARHLASVFLDEIADAVHDGLDEHFGLARYAEKLAEGEGSFDPLARALSRPPTLLDRWIDALAAAAYRRHHPRLVGLSVPFPGALYAAFRIAARMKASNPAVITVLGGGYVNTELRELNEPRVFDRFDYVTYDDGEIPLLRIAQSIERPATKLVRTKMRQGGAVVTLDDATAQVLRHRERPVPDFSGLARAGYLAMAESPNPMHRLWTDRPWLKLTLAHGCYWRRCAFCDTSLDYIRRYDPADAATVVGWMEQASQASGLTGFHFVDEAAPPALLGHLAQAILARGLRVEWWANIRFERQFTPELCRLLAASGCLAMSGGLECGHDRLLALMDKGITTAQAATAMQALSDSGIMVHAYLMYGYPSQTAQELVDALELVRSLFAARALHSAYWHRFALTAHSIALHNAAPLKLRLHPAPATTFARNEIAFAEPRRRDPGIYGEGLHKAVYNYMHGVGLDLDVRSWFAFPMPAAHPYRLERSPVAPQPAPGLTLPQQSHAKTLRHPRHKNPLRS